MAAAPGAEPTGTAIEALFRPSIRYHDQLGNDDFYERLNWREVELLPGLTVENVLATGITWKKLRRFANDKIVWMTTGVFLCSQFCSQFMIRLDEPPVLLLGAEADASLVVLVTPGTAAASATATCDFLLRLLAASEKRDIFIRGESPPISGAGISIFFQESRSCLGQVTLFSMALNEDLCRALATMSRLDVELVIRNCSLADDAAGAFIECLQSDRGPVNLRYCEIESQILANALTGNSRATSLEPGTFRRAMMNADTEMSILFTALANNRGLLDLNLKDCAINDENWSVLCQSLRAHPTMTLLDLRETTPQVNPGGVVRIVLSEEQKAQRARLLAEMMQTNTVLQTIHFYQSDMDQEIYTKVILPRLKMNLYRPRVLAIKETDDSLFREKLLGRALYCVKSNPSLVWMFLSQNVDAFVRSEEEEEDNGEETVLAVEEAAAAIASEENNSEETAAVEEAATVAGSKRKR
jgi:hypothetical protein